MNSCAQPSRRIASNLLWTAGRVIRNPLVEVGADGRLRLVGTCPQPDRLPFTEFYAGLLVAGFLQDYRFAFAFLKTRRETPLADLFAEFRIGGTVPEHGTFEGGPSAASDGVSIAAAYASATGAGTVAVGSDLRFPVDLPAGSFVVLSGLEYDPLRLTIRSQIRLIDIFR